MLGRNLAASALARYWRARNTMKASQRLHAISTDFAPYQLRVSVLGEPLLAGWQFARTCKLAVSQTVISDTLAPSPLARP
jgi:hypothetical protein